MASESLCHNDPGRFMMRCYAIPEEATSGKDKVQIHLTSPTGTRTGGLFYAFMMSTMMDATGINQIPKPVNPVQNGIYDLLGRQLSVAPHGISIVDGKKISR